MILDLYDSKIVVYKMSHKNDLNLVIDTLIGFLLYTLLQKYYKNITFELQYTKIDKKY